MSEREVEPPGLAASAAHHVTQFRPEIQALRALAVMLVLTYHLWTSRVPGGFIGVDVFFVISGYLITGQLLKEVERTGSIRLLEFWGRRIRRLLPAAFVVLLVTIVGVMLFLPTSMWSTSLVEAAASALYVENWVSIARHLGWLPWVDYPLPVEHFWTLSVEEQFYLVWPLLILLALAIATMTMRGRATAAGRLQVIAIVLGCAFILSFVYSLWLSSEHQLHAIRSTMSAAWEFAAGGLLAFAPRIGALRLAERLRFGLHLVASWLGLALILGWALFAAEVPHPAPGSVIPVLGAALFIWAESSRSWASPTRVTAIAPVQFVGDVSYGIYLWHQPIYVIALLGTGENVRSVGALAVVAASILLAWLSKRFIEDPFRTSPFWRPLPRTYGFALVGTVVIVGLSAVGVLVAGW